VIVLSGLIARLAFVGVALIGGVGAPLYLAHHDGAPAAVLAQGVGNYDGPWYFGGDLSAAALIIQAGTSLTVMNEQGRVANAVANTVQIRADWGQGPITGTLTPDQRQINWDNGTFWQRRALIDAATLGRPNVGGIWYAGDDATRRTLIAQAPNGTLQLMNEQGRPSPGTFTAPDTILATAWEGGVSGNLSPDGNFIGWSNGTTWRR
jgi:hypothetical protein